MDAGSSGGPVDRLTALEPPGRVADSVHALLRELILSGELAPGARLSVPDLARRLAVSRSPVREAVQRLAQDGLATDDVRRGASVARLGSDDASPLYQVREVLEGLAARLAARDPAPERVARLGEIMAAHRMAVVANDVRAHVRHDQEFHSELRSMAANAELSRVMERIQGRVVVAMLSGDTSSWPLQAVTEHEVIYAAVAAGDPDAAETAARAHIARIRSAFMARHERADTPP